MTLANRVLWTMFILGIVIIFYALIVMASLPLGQGDQPSLWFALTNGQAGELAGFLLCAGMAFMTIGGLTLMAID